MACNNNEKNSNYNINIYVQIDIALGNKYYNEIKERRKKYHQKLIIFFVFFFLTKKEIYKAFVEGEKKLKTRLWWYACINLQLFFVNYDNVHATKFLKNKEA